jgi:hypothetical protein
MRLPRTFLVVAMAVEDGLMNQATTKILEVKYEDNT